LNSPVVARVTLGGAERVGPAPKCRRSAFSEGPERSLGGVFCRGSQTCFGRNRDPKGREARSRRPSAAGRRKGPEVVTEQKTGYITADTSQSKVLICRLARDVRRNRSSNRADMSAARKDTNDTAVVTREALARPLHCARRHVGQGRWIGCRNGHR
jgi:hypothetical protein